MSSLFKRDTKNRVYMKERLARVEEMKKSIQSLCDNDSSTPEDVRPFFYKFGNSRDNSIERSSDEDGINRPKQTRRSRRESSEEESETAHHKQKKGKKHLKNDGHKKIMRNKKVDSNNIRKEKNKTRNSVSSDSDDAIYEKSAEKKTKRHSSLKSKQKETDSSSDKEFQKSKISLSGLSVMKKTGKDRVISTESNQESTSQLIKKTRISKEQSLQFKSHVVKIFNQFKVICSEYEIQMEHVKWKYFKKELTYQESAFNVIEKSKNVINNLKMELNAQKEELTNFYEKWSKSHKVQNIARSLSDNEIAKEREDTEESNKSENSSNAASAVSECDNEEIFSDEGTSNTKINVDKNKTNNTLTKVSKKLIGGNEKSDQIISSILDNKKEDKTYTRDDLKVIDANEKASEEYQTSTNEHAMNESIEDIFEDTPEDIDINDLIEVRDECRNENGLQLKELEKNNDNKDKNSFTNEKLDTKLTDKNSCPTKIENAKSKSVLSDEIVESTEEKKNDVLNDIDAEEQAKRAMLESDSETPTNDESLNEKFIESFSTNDSFEEKDVSQSKKIKCGKKEEKDKTQSNSIQENNLLDKPDELINEEVCAKRALLESNSDDSISPCDKKESLSKKHYSSDSSENSSSDNDKMITLKPLIINTSSKKNKDEDKNLTKNKKALDSREPARLPKISYTGSDKKLKMFCKVVVEKLSENALKKYKNALEKSRQYLENKELRSLIDLDRLQNNRKNTFGSTRSSLSRKAKKTKVKEIEDSLLNHLKNENAEENSDIIENIGEDSDINNDISIAKIQANFQTNRELMLEADAVTKKALLYSSDSDIGERKESTSENSNSEEDKSKTKSKDLSKRSTQKVEKKSSDKENDDKWKKNKWRRNKLLTMKFSSDSDSDVAREKWNKKQKGTEKAEESHIKHSAIKVAKRERRNRRQIIDSDSDLQVINSDTKSNKSAMSEDSDSSVGKPKKLRKRKTHKSSDSDSSIIEKRTKPKRRRIKNMSSNSDENSDKDLDITNSQGTPGKKGRKNIRKVMKDKQVTSDTKQAAKEEEERLKRIAERQKLYNEMYEARLAGEEKVDKLVLDFDPETKEELVTVHENLVKRLKPHQAEGIKFMWDACFESLERVNSSSGSGCIIAHCMGLGKTLQVIALGHTLLTHEKTGVKTIMIVCPLSTVLNWVNEFTNWLKDIEHDIEIYEMTKLRKNIERKFQLESWQRTGGVLIIGYEMFRNLSGTNNKMRKNIKEAVLQYLINPGPDVVVCDEGHLLKNEDTALSKSMKQIKTLRRIVLTGTPLQNNLIEYHCMVQFVKPNLLGTKKEFSNRFGNPITNGQFDDSTEYDVTLMKKRAYVLHKMLKGCVQRFDYSVLTPFLPPKQEYVIFVSLTEMQINMYQYYLDNFARRIRNANGSLFADFQSLQRIWTHPLVLRMNAEKIEKINEKKFEISDSEGSLKDFIDDAEIETTTSMSTEEDDDIVTIDTNVTKNIRTNSKNNRPEAEIIPEESEKKEEEWWLQFVKLEHFEDMRVSSKLILLFGILKECEQIGDKVLVFSQSLYSLSLIEQFLEKIDNTTQNGENLEYIDGHTGSWSLGLDYFRMDGQTSAENRNAWCRIFNEPSNTRARLFLISTRAGGLGINLTAANRVIIFDASWNPSHDVQSIFRVYRFGQKKPCYVYRFLAAGTMEEKIYNRQVTKLSLSCRVVDEQQIERHYSNQNLNELYTFERNNREKPTLNLPKDRLLAEIFLKYKNFVENYHEHDSLLENKAEEELNEEERKQAWLEYEEEKKGKPPIMPSYSMAFPNNMMLNQYKIPPPLGIGTDYEKLRILLQKDYPNATPQTQQMMTANVLTNMYNYMEQHSFYNTANSIIDQNPNLTSVPNMAQTSYSVPNRIKNLTNQQKDYRITDIRSGDVDDDVIEVISTTVNNKNKNQEE
ncbi:transcriptional regulator ATRX homolog isoform X1 [Bombus vosnesenskii]|uniref:Transcriptional regulator ATRX homolog isoform X1 n=1 Tax=Bombus vosnesenskii TaxID=207650 RepID=A0A6J3LMU3_9HYME|nr:transcriptional regulator ATRX homolog isoform X1 [Bombus vosnesenskii]